MFGVRVKKSQPGLRLRHDGRPALSRSSSSPATSAAMTTSTSAASLAPVGNTSGNSHHFPNDKEPQDMTRRTARSQAGAQPCTQDRDNDKQCGACEERLVRGNLSADKIVREKARQQRVSCDDQND